MIDLEAARALLDFGRRIGEGHRAEEQLRGAVAIHNILKKHRVAYLADEVGMGKTYVALGALALLRHYQPDLRVLVVAPRENIQRKWQKELRNFAAHNVRFDDLRMRALDGQPARPLVSCGNLLELVRETSIDPDRDFFVRMSSFSLPLGRSGEDWQRTRDALQRQLPWLAKEAFDLRDKQAFKSSFAQAICCALPKFDLVIVDEAHNLKHGYSASSSARNQVLAEVFGRAEGVESKKFPHYGPRAERLLFLSATPLEETYRHVWNQLDIFGLANAFSELRDDHVPEAGKKEVARQFLVRRVTSIRIGDRQYTKNMYRREWRSGGVSTHDDPITITDPRQRLVVALVQKKVSELLASERFKNSFQIGMLASFESFLETAKLSRGDEDVSTFDDADQTDVAIEREGIDVRDLNRLARDYRSNFQREMPHPKMDAIVDRLSDAWTTGDKSLVFVRRVASVKELKRKLDERYDDWLIPYVRERLPEPLRSPFDAIVTRYREEKPQAGAAVTQPIDVARTDVEIDDHGGNDTFFAWFFRGEGPKGILSGANIQGRFIKASGAYATFFADNHVADLLGVEPGNVLDSLTATLGRESTEVADEVARLASKYISHKAKRVTRAARFDAVQAGALELLRDKAIDPAHRDAAGIMWEERYRTAVAHGSVRDTLPDLGKSVRSSLETATFFTTLRLPRWSDLRDRIWPVPNSPDFRTRFREQILRAELLAAAARLGHAFIDLYIASMVGRTTLSIGRDTEVGDDAEADDGERADDRLLREYLERLDAQAHDPAHPWGALEELSEIAAHYELILDVNIPDARTAPLVESAREVARLLRQQQPTGGMSGQVNQTLVRQFRMPGYPFVLVTTDLLQEGEDLHTFCSSIHHYGISWTPSAMEQRIGRIDRVRSQTDRRLATLDREPTGADWLQVYFPHLQDTVEVLQVERVLDRMNAFLRLMHEDLAVPPAEQRRIDVQREIVATRRRVAAIREPLESAFPVPEWATRGSRVELEVHDDVGNEARRRFTRLAQPHLGGVPIEWAPHPPLGALLGSASLLSGRVQPFTLLLRSERGRPVVRCVSPVGRTDPGSDPDAIVRLGARLHSRVGAIPTKVERSYDLTLEDDVLLGDPEHDFARVGLLVRRITGEADNMEREHFEDRRDVKLDVFEADLRKEGSDGD
jgi:superfamily II DNA or RNA helicase